jgi:hypothetical protein
MIGRGFHPQPGVRSEHGAGFIGLLVNIGIPAEDNVLRGLVDFVELIAKAMCAFCPFIDGIRGGEAWSSVLKVYR